MPDEPQRGALRRWLAPFTVVLALVSAFLTFVVLTGLTGSSRPGRSSARSC